MERDGLPWGGGYDDDSRSFTRSYAESLWGDKVEKPASAPKQPASAPKQPAKAATSKAEIQDSNPEEPT